MKRVRPPFVPTVVRIGHHVFKCFIRKEKLVSVFVGWTLFTQSMYISLVETC